MKPYININSDESIGDSLPTVNLNYYNLEYDVTQMLLRKEILWNPILNYCKEYIGLLDQITSISQSYSSVFIETATIVENNSAGWIKPITIFYPSLLPSVSSTESIVREISSWVHNYFPVIDNITFYPKYVEDQTIIVNCHTWNIGNIISESQDLLDYTKCYTHDSVVCVLCTSSFHGSAWCGTYTLVHCESQSSSCQQCSNIYCGYNFPPYSNYYGSSHVVAGTIAAKVNMNFIDRNELDKINSLVFKIKNCAWVFDRFIS